MLQSIPSSRLRSVAFNSLQTRRLYGARNSLAPQLPCTPALFDQAELGALDSIITGMPFESLEEVVIDIWAHKEDQEELLKAHAQRYLPKLHERKIVRLHVRQR